MPQLINNAAAKTRLRRALLCIAIIASLSAGTFAQSQNPGTGKTQFNQSRPMLFFTAERVSRLRERAAEDTVLKQASDKIIERADRLLEAELVSKEYAEGGSGQHGNYGRPSSQISGMGPTLGLAYQLTGDKRYAGKLRDAMIHYGNLNRWAGDAHHDPPWHSELNTARFCYGYAVGYDSIYDFLSADERKTIAGVMVRLGIRPTLDDWVLGEKRIHALDSMGHNWWSVCVSMAGLAALSLAGDVPQAEAWAHHVSDVFPEWFYYQGNILQNKPANFDSKGAFYESVSYANYALSEYLLFRLAYSNVFGESASPDIPLLQTAGDFFIHSCYPTSDSLLSVNFGDSSLRTNGSQTIRLLLANGYDKPQYHWYLAGTDRGLGDPVGLLYDKLQPGQAAGDEYDKSILYPDIGWAVLRSSWQDNATMLAVKSGFAWNHAHPDAGSFILFHQGVPLIIDSGNCSYSRREYTSYYRHSRAHNVILTGGNAQNPEDCGNGDRGTVTPGSISRLFDTPGLRYVFADATGPTSWKFSRNYRHFLWLDGVILIFDDVRTHEAGRLEWLLHYQDKAEKQGEQILLSNGDARALVQPVFPEGMQIVEKKGLKDHDPDTEVTYLAFTPEKSVREAKFITAVFPLEAGSEKPAVQIERLNAGEDIGVRISDGKTITDIYLNLRADGRKMHRNSCNIIDGWDTDAYLFAVTRPKNTDENDPDSVARYLVVCGSYLRKDGKVMLDSLSKVDTVFLPGRQTKVWLEGQPVMNVFLRIPSKPENVILNGRSVKVLYNETTRTIGLGTNLPN